MMMAFLPASVLAGTPLRLCVGDDGHRAIEFVLTADHHAAVVQGTECAEPDKHQVAPASSGCTDSQLLSAAQKPAPLAELERQLAADELLSFAVLATVVAVPTLFDVSEPNPEPLRAARRKPQLDALRTVVLQI